ncbi:hypothetical protein [Conexibacter woesei]|nr:hypothetical protein [Conexibacter woesei]
MRNEPERHPLPGARDAYGRAIALSGNAAARDELRRRLVALSGSGA